MVRDQRVGVSRRRRSSPWRRGRERRRRQPVLVPPVRAHPDRRLRIPSHRLVSLRQPATRFTDRYAPHRDVVSKPRAPAQAGPVRPHPRGDDDPTRRAARSAARGHRATGDLSGHGAQARQYGDRSAGHGRSARRFALGDHARAPAQPTRGGGRHPKGAGGQARSSPSRTSAPPPTEPCRSSSSTVRSSPW